MAFHLAQCNIVKLKAPLDSPVVAGFVAALEPVNALADAAPGFVWRLKTDEGDATSIRVFDDEHILLNLSVWESKDALTDFVYRSGHKDVLRQRRQWADRFDGVQSAMWWVRAGTIPEPSDAVARLECLESVGPSEYAFTFQSSFDAPPHDTLP
ncbi:MAG TPA: DUF3291 domain-containing protein [Acidimicrobiales bacterium]|nr:DUF3291 domain-containing protein [Acidimicrobiales bacterium]